jgi:hypothetical protein
MLWGSVEDGLRIVVMSCAEKQVQEKINLELSPYWPAWGVSKLNFTFTITLRIPMLPRVSDNSSRHKIKEMADAVLGCTVGPESLKELSGKEPRNATHASETSCLSAGKERIKGEGMEGQERKRQETETWEQRPD